jgi:hypothetical protein
MDIYGDTLTDTLVEFDLIEREANLNWCDVMFGTQASRTGANPPLQSCRAKSLMHRWVPAAHPCKTLQNPRHHLRIHLACGLSLRRLSYRFLVRHPTSLLRNLGFHITTSVYIALLIRERSSQAIREVPLRRNEAFDKNCFENPLMAKYREISNSPIPPLAGAVST